MADTILELMDVTVDFKGFLAVDAVSLSVGRGEVRTIIGPNGAGKSTLIDLITGKTRLKFGKIVFDGADITLRPPHEIAHAYGIGRKFQGPNTFFDMSVFDNLLLALRGSTGVGKSIFYRRTDDARGKIDDILRIIGLEDKKDTLVSALSYGEKQWVEIGMVLAQDAKLVILDEPTTGMTADETYKTGEMIRAMRKDRTIIVSEHDMDFVRQVAETVTVMNQGKILAEGTFEEIRQNPEVIRVYLKE
ncbi:MAG: ATP-binding cassette domain-containing protein [Clostridiales Family XIII bacterium]|jgi:urea transport system ATP-binding protein|nr:ATP-binding cassette domain-containing protein [Clostridiales Family XIII bacterium]